MLTPGPKRRPRPSEPTGAVKALTLMLAAAVLLVSAAGCGKKAPPRPPKAGLSPPPVGDLEAAVDEGAVELSWTVPPPTDRHRLPAEGFRVLLSRRLSVDECPGCPPNFKPAGELKAPGRPAQTETMRFRYPLETGYRYRFKVVSVAGDGTLGPASDTVAVEK